MKVSKDFPSRFLQDNFVQRRSVGNLYDPESLISGAEISKGMTYTNSSRNWANEFCYQMATEGTLTVAEILNFAPRTFDNKERCA